MKDIKIGDIVIAYRDTPQKAIIGYVTSISGKSFSFHNYGLNDGRSYGYVFLFKNMDQYKKIISGEKND